MRRQLEKPGIERTNARLGAGWSNQPIAIASRFIEDGKDREAEQLLLKWRPKNSKLEAERLALLGFVRWRLGDTKAYRSLAVEAANKARTSLTLYHLGLALPPEEGLAALRGAFEAYSGDREREGRVAYALARVLRRLGRFPEAYRWASLAVQSHHLVHTERQASDRGLVPHRVVWRGWQGPLKGNFLHDSKKAPVRLPAVGERLPTRRWSVSYANRDLLPTSTKTGVCGLPLEYPGHTFGRSAVVTRSVHEQWIGETLVGNVV